LRAMSERLDARLRLLLRAEQAFGVDAVRRPDRSVVAEATTPATTSVEPTRREAPVAPTAAQSPVDLWGRPASEQSAVQRGLVRPPSVEPFSAESVPAEQKALRLQQLDENEVKGCTRCRLCEQP